MGEARRLAFDLHAVIAGEGNGTIGAPVPRIKVLAWHAERLQKPYLPHSNTNMHFLSSLHKKVTPASGYVALGNNEPTDPEAWKARLIEQLLPPHERSSSDQLISEYLIEDKKSDLNLLVWTCMENGNVDVLAYVLANEDIKRLCIERPVDERGLKTLAKAMPDNLLVEALELELSKKALDAGRCELLFNSVLSRMPALEALAVRGVKVNRSYLFEQLRCPAFPRLTKLEVSGAGAYAFLRKLLDACQVRDLNVTLSGALSARKHSKLANTLRDQTQMNRLRLRTMHRGKPEEFESYLPFFNSNRPTPLFELELSGWLIQEGSFKKLIEALSSNQPALEGLFLSGCLIPSEPTYKTTVNIDLTPLAKLNGLEHLDLSSNHLSRGSIVALFKALREAASPLVTLNVSGNQIGPPTLSAIAALLRESRTLGSLSFDRSALEADLGASVQMEELVEAVEHNKSLLELQFRWPLTLADCRAKVDAYLDRNRKHAFMGVALQTAAEFVMPRLLMGPEDQKEFLNRRQLPQEFIGHIIGKGLTEHDALTLSSLNKDTRAAHEEFLRKTGS